jgi:hypothetical protein
VLARLEERARAFSDLRTPAEIRIRRHAARG